MPRSSGGGSHSGGSHSSSSHSSRRSTPRYRSSRTYFPGSYRYVRYRNNQPEYIYSNDPNMNRKSIKSLFIYLPLLAIVGFYLGSLVHIPHKMETVYENPVEIVDGIAVLGSTGQLEDTLSGFYAETGIPVSIVTTDNAWKAHYDAPDDFAYDLYVDRFKDEDHWLIVYTSDQGKEYDDWYFEGMQGDNTTGILSEDITDSFNESLTSYLGNRSLYSVSDAFNKAFSDLTPDVMKVHINWGEIVIATIFIIIVGYAVVSEIKGIAVGRQYQKCSPDMGDDPNAPNTGTASHTADRAASKGNKDERRCGYCNAVVHGKSMKTCPKCGAPLG